MRLSHHQSMNSLKQRRLSLGIVAKNDINQWAERRLQSIIDPEVF